jgi:lysophospholipase L1-like esterase
MGSSLTSVYLFAGDSITEGICGESYVERAAGALYQGWAGLAGQAVNAGYSGETVQSLLGRIGGLLQAYQPGWLVLAIGTNDVWLPWRSRHSLEGWLWVHYRRLRFGQRPTGDLDQFATAYHTLIDEAQQAGARVLACTPSPLGEQLASSPNRQLARLNGVIRQVAAERGVPLADVWQAFVEPLAVLSKPSHYLPVRLASSALDRRRLRTVSPDKLADRRGLHYTFDGIHLNSRGADLWAHAVLTALARAQERTARF